MKKKKQSLFKKMMENEGFKKKFDEEKRVFEIEQALYRICYVFSLFAVLAALTAGMVYACIWLYELKTSLGIDIFPGFSFFH